MVKGSYQPCQARCLNILSQPELGSTSAMWTGFPSSNYLAAWPCTGPRHRHAYTCEARLLPSQQMTISLPCSPQQAGHVSQA